MNMQAMIGESEGDVSKQKIEKTKHLHSSVGIIIWLLDFLRKFNKIKPLNWDKTQADSKKKENNYVLHNKLAITLSIFSNE